MGDQTPIHNPYPLLTPSTPSRCSARSLESTSANLSARPGREVLEVGFQAAKSTSILGCRATLYTGLLAARSKGRYFGEFVRLRYHYEKIR